MKLIHLGKILINNLETGNKTKNSMIIEKNSSNHTKKETKNRFYIPQYNKRTETLMNILTEDYSSEKNEDNKEEELEDKAELEAKNDSVVEVKKDTKKKESLRDIFRDKKGSRKYNKTKYEQKDSNNTNKNKMLKRRKIKKLLNTM